MKSKTDKPSSRREFLKTASLSAGVVAAGAVIETGSVKAEGLPKENKNAGYTESDHVKKYYELARI